MPLTGASHEVYNSPTLQELNIMLSSGKNTAVGPDRIHYSMRAHLSEASTKTLLTFFNMIWKFGTILKQWQKCCSDFISKSG